MDQSLHRNFRFLPTTNINSFVIWLDETFNDSSVEYNNGLSQLSQVTNKLKVFTDRHQCIDFLTDIQNDKVYFIISQDLSTTIVPIIHDFYQIKHIFLHGAHQQTLNDYSKIQGSYTNVSMICDFIGNIPKTSEQSEMNISLLDTSDGLSNKELDKLDPTFMYSQILVEIMLDIPFNEEHFNEFIDYCRQVSRDNDAELRNIEKFKRNYCDETAIKWYTSERFLYTTVNSILRIVDGEAIVKMGYYIVQLYRQIEESHKAQYSIDKRHESLKLYRGQVIPNEQFEKISKTKGGLIAFNNFLSTSKDREVSLIFASNDQNNSQLTSILFVITGDPLKSSAAFASIDNISQFSVEEEVLFVMHAVFRIGDIKQMPGPSRHFEVELTLTDETDEDLKILRNYIKTEIPSSYEGWHRLAETLSQMGLFNKAQQLLEKLLRETDNELRKAALYSSLGKIYYGQAQYKLSVEYYKKSLDIQNRLALSDSYAMSTTYNNLGSVYKKIGDYEKALFYHEKALELQQQIFPPNSPHLGNSYNNIGLLHFSMHDYSKALSHYMKSLAIRQLFLPRNHPRLAQCFNNIALTYYHIKDYSEALKSQKNALEIQERSLPADHPDKATCHNNIGIMYASMGNYSAALSSHKSALKMREALLSASHPDIAESCKNIGKVHYINQQYCEALPPCKKAVEIAEQSLPSNHPHLVDYYHMIAAVYYRTNDYFNAVLYYEKALTINQLLSRYHQLNLVKSYVELGERHGQINNYDQSLSYYQKALAIFEQIYPPNHPNFAACYNNIGTTYCKKLDINKALFFIQKALAIQQQSFSPDHPDLLATIKNINTIYSMEDTLTAFCETRTERKC